MKKILFIALLTLSLRMDAQYQWDYGLKLGAANYLGDIGGKDLPRRDFIWDMHIRQTSYAVGAYGRYKFSKRLALNVNFDHISIQDADKHSTYAPRRARNLNFRNRMFEFGARAEFTLWYDNDVGNRGFYNPDYKLYAFGGVSAYYSNPQARLVYDGFGDPIDGINVGDFVDDTWYNLRDYRTEGVAYSNIGLGVPLGIGMYFTFNKQWRIGWEVCWRMTFNDYLDDVSDVYAEPDPVNAEDLDLAYDLQSQSYAALVNELNKDLPAGQSPMTINDFRYQNPPSAPSLRGYQTNNDNYITTQITIGKVIRGRSKFYKSKYSWVKNRSMVRRSKAKF